MSAAVVFSCLHLKLGVKISTAQGGALNCAHKRCEEVVAVKNQQWNAESVPGEHSASRASMRDRKPLLFA